MKFLVIFKSLDDGVGDSQYYFVEASCHEEALRKAMGPQWDNAYNGFLDEEHEEDIYEMYMSFFNQIDEKFAISGDEDEDIMIFKV